MFKRYLTQMYAPPESGGSGGGRVTQLPEVPSPSEADLEALGDGDDDSDDGGDDPLGEGDEGEEGEGERAPARRRRPPEEVPPEESEEEEEDFDIDEGEEDEEEEERPKPKAKAREDTEEEKRIPSFKAIKEKYPNFLKEFPHVRQALGEHQQLKNIFSTVDDAKEAAAHQQNFLEFSERLMQGDFGHLLTSLKKSDDPESVGRLARNILPEIMKADRNLYLEITETPIKQFVKAAFDQAGASGNNNLKNAALHVWKFLTGKMEDPQINDKPDPRDEEFNNRVKNFELQKHKEALTTAKGEADATLEDLVGKSIDPNNALKAFTKKALVKTLIGDIEEALSTDEAHVQRMDRLWAAARRAQYSRGHISRIVNAYLERAKNVLPRLAAKVREEHGTAPAQKKEGQQQQQQKQNQLPARPQGQGRPPQPKSLRDTNPRNIDWQKTSDEDVLAGRAKLRRR